MVSARPAVLWAAVLGALVVLVAIPNFGLDAESFRAGLHSALARMLRIETGMAQMASSTCRRQQSRRLIDFLVAALPRRPRCSHHHNTFNLWLAARIVKFSGC